MARFYMLSSVVFLLLFGNIETRSATNFFHLANQSVAPGDPVTFTLTGNYPADLWIQWYHWGVMIQNSTNTQLVLPNVTADHSGLYWVRVTEEMQEALPNTMESLTNQNASAWLAVGPPYIEPLPMELSANEGSDFIYQATVVSSQPVNCQWRRNGVPIQDATNTTLLLRRVRLEDAGIYAIRATSPSGSADSTGLKLIVQPRYQLDQSQTDFGAWATMRDVNLNVSLAQTFTPAVSGRLMRLVISMIRDASPTRLRIVDAPNGIPGTNVLGTVFLSGELMEADFSEQTVFLNAGVPYAIEYWTDAPPSTSVTYRVRTSHWDVYAGGALWSRNDLTKGPWRRVTLFNDGVTGMDAVFETWMAPGLPECRITNPLLGARVNEGSNMEIAAECALDPSITIVAVRFFVGDIEIGAATDAPYNVAWTATAPGEHLLKASAEDSTGKLYMSEPVAIVVLPTSRPANDDFADRTILTGTYLRNVIDSSGASIEPDEPQISTNSTGTLWWSWTAPDTRPVTITAQNSQAPGLPVTVYRGGMLESLLFVTNGAPECIFTPTAGETYAIAIALGTNNGNVVLDLASADIGLLEPTSGQVTAPVEQRLRTSTSVARSITNLIFLTNGITLAEAAAVPAIITNIFNASGYYDLQVEARDERGIRTISRPVKFTVRPQNDSLSSPIAVTGYSGSVVGSTLASTRQSTDPQFAENQGGRSIWYTWVAPASGICKLQGTGPGTGLILGAYIMKQGVLEMIAVNAMAPPGVPIEFQAVEGQTYYFWIDGYLGEEGVVQWSYALRPGNDEFVSRGLITGESFHQVLSIRGSRLEGGEPPLPLASQPPVPPSPWVETGSVWWSWTAPLSGAVQVSLTAGESAAGIGIYSGAALEALVLIDETMVTNSTVVIEFQATKGTTYQLRIVGNSDSTELLSLDLVVESLRIVNPLDASVHREPATILLEAHLQSGESLSSLRFQVNGEWLTNEVANNGLLWEQVGAGTYTIVGSGRTESGTEFTSKPITVLVYKDDVVPQPRIFTGRFGYSSYVVNAVGEVQVFGDRPTQFPSFSHADNFFPAVAFSPVGVKGWTQLASSWDGIWHFGLAKDGRIFRKDGTIVPFPEGVSAWKALDIGFSTLVSIGDNGRAYANGVPIPDAPDGGGWLDYRIGQYQSLGLTGKGNLYGFWLNSFAQLQITEIEKPSGVTSWRQFDSALRSGLFLGDNGELYHLPMESSEGSFSPILVQKPVGVTGWLKFCSGGFHHMVIGNNGALYTWGRNWEGQLGVGTTGNDRALQMVPFPPGVTAWTEVAAGYMHSIAIANDCSLYSWGPNYVGELGLGRQPLQSSPARVANVQNLCGTPIMFLDGDRSRLEDGSFAVRFDTVLNRTIVIQYSSDMQEWFTANGVVNGTGEPVTWIDDGPPKTRTHPREDGVRFYRFSFGQ